jgi:hypothetical protein
MRENYVRSASVLSYSLCQWFEATIGLNIKESHTSVGGILLDIRPYTFHFYLTS